MKLSEVPISLIFIGMEVISAVGTEGKVVGMSLPSHKNPYDGDFGLTIEWSNGKQSTQPHYLMDNVIVK